MDAKEFGKRLRTPEEIHGVYLFSGEEEFVKTRMREQLRAAFFPEGMEEFGETRLPHNAPAEDIIAACEQVPFMVERRLVSIEDSALFSARAGEKSLEALTGYLGAIPPSCCLLFYSHGAVDMRNKLAQAIAKQNGVVAFDWLSEGDLQRWAAKELQKTGQLLALDALQELLLRSGRSLGALEGELKKLSAYAQGRAEITHEDVIALIAPSLESSVFTLVDALAEGRTSAAFSLLNRLVQSGESRIMVLAMLARNYRLLLHAKVLLEAKCPQAEIEKRLGASRFVIGRVCRQCAKLDKAFLREALRLCVETDAAIKSGHMREEIALESAMFRLGAGTIGTVLDTL